MRRNPLLALALAAAAGACTLERPTPDDNPDLRYESAEVPADDAQRTMEVSGGPGPGETAPYETPAPTTPVPVRDERGGLTVTGRFLPVNNYPINASLTVSGVEAAGTLVSVAVYDAGPSTVFRGAIVRGPCENPGAEVAPLDLRFQIGSTGVGAASDTVAVPATTVMNGQHAVVLKTSNAGPATPPVACAPIPANQQQTRP
ncbi:MAG TPA: hypothetical protein VHG51_01715 [Longimicrobiaceae bacterium]|nr:hypothetical protein [Longimicrobiaceae bacterium]